MNKYAKFFAVVVGILVLSVILTTPAYWLLSPFFRFEKIFDRLVMILAVLAAFVFVLRRRSNQGAVMSPGIWRECGFDFSVNWKRLIAVGFGAGTVMVILLTVAEVAFGPRYLRQPILLADVVQRFIKGLLSGMTIGVVEEFFFRGFIFVYLKKILSLVWAVLVGSVFYSLCHFFDNGMIFIPAYPKMRDAARLMFGYLEPLVHRPLAILPEFFGLFLFGIVLSLAFIRTRNLFFSIGLHAGVVFLIKFQFAFVRPEPSGSPMYDPWFGQKPFYDGPAEWIFLFLLAMVAWHLSRGRNEAAR